MRVLSKLPLRTMAIAAVLMMATACDEPTANTTPAPPPAPPEVSVVRVQPQKLVITDELPGRTSVYQISEVRPQVNGIVLKRLFREGSDVSAGDPLYQIDPDTYQAAYALAKADLAKANAGLKVARLKADRYITLVKTDTVSRQAYDDAIAAVEQAESQVAAAKAALDAALINLDHTKVSAPISGRIGRSNVTEGAIVTAYQSMAMATIQQLDPIYVDAPQSTTSLLRLRSRLEGGYFGRSGTDQNKVNLILEDGTAYPLEGKLQFSDITVDPTTGSVILRMAFPNPKGVLLPGMFVRVVINEGLIEQAILIPQQAVFRDPKGNPIALIVDSESKVGLRMLTLDRAISDKWLVSAGIAPGDQVIVEGLKMLRPGTVVKAVPFNESTITPAAETN